MANVKVGDRIVMKDGAPYCYTVGGTTGTVTKVYGTRADVDFDAPIYCMHPVDIKHVEVIKESTMFDHDTARSGKIGAIKALRAFVPDLSLRDAKDVVESIGASYDSTKETTELDAQITALNTELDAMRAAYNDLLAYVPTDRLIDLLRK